MMQVEKKALTEVNYVLKYSTLDVIKKIPYRFRRYVVKNMDKEYIPDIKLGVPFESQNISERTKYILALIYRDYLRNN